MIEARTILSKLKVVIQLNFQHVIIESDSKMVVDIIRRGYTPIQHFQ